MTSNNNHVRLNSAAIDVADDKLILRGVLDAADLSLLKVDDYQRDTLPIKSLQGIVNALRQGDSLPDVELGMRGDKHRHRDGSYTLLDDVYIIDGLQRISAASYAIQTGMDPSTVRLGARVNFDTDKDWERERFRVLNTLRKPVSPNVVLRNTRYENSATSMIFELCSDTRFALHGRVSWNQHMNRGDLVTASVLCRTIGALHSHKGPGLSSSLSDMVRNLKKIEDEIGSNIFRENIIVYFNVLDQAFGLRHVQHKEAALHLRSGFLFTLARTLSMHKDFWKNAADSRLFIDADARNKLGSFNFQDPLTRELVSGVNRWNTSLFHIIVDHFNRGKQKKNQLTRRPLFEDYSQAVTVESGSSATSAEVVSIAR